MFIVKDFGKALLKTNSSPIFFSNKLSERKPLFEIARCLWPEATIQVCGTEKYIAARQTLIFRFQSPTSIYHVYV